MKMPFNMPLSGPHKLLASSAIIQGSGMAVTMLIGIQLARYLGPYNYGIYGATMAVVSIATVVAQFGLPPLAIREAATANSTNPTGRSQAVIFWFARSSAVISLIVTTILVGLFLLWLPASNLRQPYIPAYAAAAIFIFSVLSTMVGLLRGLGRNLEGQAIEYLLRPTLIVLALFGVNWLGGSLSVGQALAVQVGVAVLVLCWIAFKIASQIGRSFKKFHYGPEHWKAAASSMLFTAVLLAINANYPLLVASPFVSTAELGIFRVALSCAALIALPVSIASISIGPVAARLVQGGDKPQLDHYIAHTTIPTFAVTAVLLLIVIVAGGPVISFLFGQEYAAAREPLIFFGFAQLIVAAFGATASYLNVTGRERVVVKAFFISVPIGMVAAVPMAALFGINGAASGNLVMVCLWHGYVFLIDRRSIDVPLSLCSAWRHLRAERAPALPMKER